MPQRLELGAVEEHTSAVHSPHFCARSPMDRASDYGSEGWGFESLRARHSLTSGFSQETPADLRRCRPPSSSRCCQTYPVVSLPVGETRGKPVPQGVLVGDSWGTTPAVRG